MFSVHCGGHGGRVLLGNRAITGIVNTDHGIEVHWRCHCGTTGAELTGVLAEAGEPVPAQADEPVLAEAGAA